MVASTDSSSKIDALMNEVKNILDSRQRQSAPAPQATQPSKTESVGAPGTFKPPIRATWYNVGAFNPQAVRYDDPKGAKTGRGHKGVDMSTSAGTPVYAFGAGTVTNVSTSKVGGNNVTIKHDGGISTYYAHLSTVAVHPGDKVDTNTVIGAVGNSGNAGDVNRPGETLENGRTFPHLHFEVHTGGGAVDPAKYMTVPPYNGDYAKNPRKYLSFWSNDKAKQDAQAFNMKGHLASRRTAFSRDVDRLLKVAFEFAKLSDQSK